MSTVDPAAPASAAAAQDTRPPAPAPAAHDAHRGKLFRKYLLLILSLVSAGLLVSGGISLYFNYRETSNALASLQQEKAVGAAARIEQYLRQLTQQLQYAALPQLDAGDVELRRIEFLKLLRQAPEVTDIALIDANGREVVAESRLGMSVVGSGRDRSAEPAFTEPRRGQPWYGPVYFRKETEPYMTVAIRSGGEKSAVTVAELNLKFIWDVVSRIKIGDKGKAYVVDRNGYLVADPDIGLVLRKTNLAGLAHVQAASAPSGSAEPAMLSRDLAGTRVLAAVAPIEPLDWKVFVEQPVSEVFARLNASILWIGALLLAGLAASALAAGALARSMVRPIRTLDEGARRIGAGDLDQQIVIKTGDELEGLADQFNRMSGQLRESYAGLERKVEQRTAEVTRGAGLPDRDQRGAACHWRFAHRRARRCSRRSWTARNACSAPRLAPVFHYDGRMVNLVATRGWSSEASGRRAQVVSRAAEPGHAQRPRDSFRPDADHRRHPHRPALRRHHGAGGPVAAHDRRADDQGRVADRGHRGGLGRSGRDTAASGRSAQDLRRPGGDRHRERAAVQRNEGGAGAADRHGRDPEGHQPVRRPTCSRCSKPSCAAACRCSTARPWR